MVVRLGESPPSSKDAGSRDLDDAFFQTQTRIWLAQMLQVIFEEDASFADLLMDGELLFQLSKVMWKKLMTHPLEEKNLKVTICDRNVGGSNNARYMAYPKIESFLKICKILGLTAIDLFSPSDVVERRNTRRVCVCIHTLSKKARLKGLEVPDFDCDFVACTVAMPNDMVGYIHRSLEGLQSGLCSSLPVCRFLRVAQICRWQKSTLSDLQEADNAYKDFQLQSCQSNMLPNATDFSSDRRCGGSFLKTDRKECSFIPENMLQDDFKSFDVAEKFQSSETLRCIQKQTAANLTPKVHSSIGGSLCVGNDSPQPVMHLQDGKLHHLQLLSSSCGKLSYQLDPSWSGDKDTNAQVLLSDFVYKEEIPCLQERRAIFNRNDDYEDEHATVPSGSISCISEDGQSVVSDHVFPDVEGSTGNESCSSYVELVDGEAEFGNTVCYSTKTSEKISQNCLFMLANSSDENYLVDECDTPNSDSSCSSFWDGDVESCCSSNPSNAASTNSLGICVREESVTPFDLVCEEQRHQHDMLNLQKTGDYEYTEDGNLIYDLTDVHLLLMGDHTREHGSQMSGQNSLMAGIAVDVNPSIKNEDAEPESGPLPEYDLERHAIMDTELIRPIEQEEKQTRALSKEHGGTTLFKSIAGGIAIVGGALLVLHFSGKKGGTNLIAGLSQKKRVPQMDKMQRFRNQVHWSQENVPSYWNFHSS